MCEPFFIMKCSNMDYSSSRFTAFCGENTKWKFDRSHRIKKKKEKKQTEAMTCPCLTIMSMRTNEIWGLNQATGDMSGCNTWGTQFRPSTVHFPVIFHFLTAIFMNERSEQMNCDRLKDCGDVWGPFCVSHCFYLHDCHTHFLTTQDAAFIHIHQ